MKNLLFYSNYNFLEQTASSQHPHFVFFLFFLFSDFVDLPSNPETGLKRLCVLSLSVPVFWDDFIVDKKKGKKTFNLL